MRALGAVVRLQVQRSSLKTGQSKTRVYDPGPILAVDRLAVAPDGVFGLTPDGGWVVDVHHRSHPETKNPDGLHGISVGFSGHYDAMRDRFGARILLGCAGENIIVESPRRWTLDELRHGLAVLSPAGDEVLRLSVSDVAHPCRPFTGWALGKIVEPETLKEHLQFLEDGMRGFLLACDSPGFVSVGDTIMLCDTRDAGSEKREA